ncbi:3-oxoacyl-[acyl-carrier-protein] synthase III C-terminal domain-containing protein [Hyalangium rubrum]|uniref:3-oxoacyl-[acyl-carrier-protein] synthase III C-terminal domain-containing protein n=1 Tax=Hyalangium rubrum TaxID=3103134 RepID=A0ABU5H0X5_9BACT|nr:3-oxoacyl-[acyl-carrier-protein] synthase III C-terminal domain-containing protein [Hyalangium sp. s54d21]MDY7226437.1 3-oxoacyl-[acyl-carrier-protein] synthase III C-terminal domain-containing protein [Hyalangium sp. s54d21]
MSRDVFITSLGKFLPGEPISNEQMEEYLGKVRGRPSRARSRVLSQNGIKSRYYAIDREQRSRYRNWDLAVNAIQDALSRSPITLSEMDLLVTATTQADLVLPGFASQVHRALGGPACELASLHGICSAGMQALRTATLQVATGEAERAVVCASELVSRLLKAGHYEEVAGDKDALPFDAEFLRWMLSDGAGAAVLQDKPHPTRMSLKVDFIDIRSHANKYELGMYVGANRGKDGGFGTGWIDYNSFSEAAAAGVFTIKQDIRRLESLVTLGVDGFFALVDQGRIKPKEIDWFVVHFSSHYFKQPIVSLLEKGGIHIPEERWFSNLSTRGNTGCASIFLMLEELLNEGRFRPGERVFCMVPESGGFITCYAMLTVVAPSRAAVPELSSAAPAPMAEPGPLPLAPKEGGDPVREKLVRELTHVWVDFEAKLQKVPVIEKLVRGVFTVEDYRELLINMRQQVVEGSRWIARAASSITAEHLALRSSFIRHARDEHRDYEMLERHYVSVGGTQEAITRAPKNIGSEALSAWMFHRASQENPFDLLGAMFIIEGLGNRVARRWGLAIREQLGLQDEQVRFFLYHGDNDATHLDRLEGALGSGILTPELAARIVKTAKVTARLYLLQLEELGHV